MSTARRTRATPPAADEPKEARRWTITVPAWHPVKLNELIGWNRFVVAKRKRSDREIIRFGAIRAEVPPATGKRRVRLTITLGPRQRGGDPDAYFKGLCDGLVHLGLLKDDSRQWVELMPVEYDRGPEKATTITLEDLD